MTPHFRPGHAARGGVCAALLAEKGFNIDEHALKADKGFVNVFSSGFNLDLCVEGLRQQFELFSNAYKLYPCGIIILSTLDACLVIRQQSGREKKAVGATLRVHPLALSLTGFGRH